MAGGEQRLGGTKCRRRWNFVCTCHGVGVRPSTANPILPQLFDNVTLVTNCDNHELRELGQLRKAAVCGLQMPQNSNKCVKTRTVAGMKKLIRAAWRILKRHE
jgi:hypothetical protein